MVGTSGAIGRPKRKGKCVQRAYFMFKCQGENWYTVEVEENGINGREGPWGGDRKGLGGMQGRRLLLKMEGTLCPDIGGKSIKWPQSNTKDLILFSLKVLTGCVHTHHNTNTTGTGAILGPQPRTHPFQWEEN